MDRVVPFCFWSCPGCPAGLALELLRQVIGAAPLSSTKILVTPTADAPPCVSFFSAFGAFDGLSHAFSFPIRLSGRGGNDGTNTTFRVIPARFPGGVRDSLRTESRIRCESRPCGCRPHCPLCVVEAQLGPLYSSGRSGPSRGSVSAVGGTILRQPARARANGPSKAPGAPRVRGRSVCGVFP